jgi:hypothetical protein
LVRASLSCKKDSVGAIWPLGKKSYLVLHWVTLVRALAKSLFAFWLMFCLMFLIEFYLMKSLPIHPTLAKGVTQRKK